MTTYNIPVKKLGITVPVSVPTDEQVHNHAAHGVKQRVNDTLAGHARGDFDSAAEYHEAGLKIIAKIIAKIEAGLVGERAVAQTLAQQVGGMTDEELAKLGLVRVTEPVAEAA